LLTVKIAADSHRKATLETDIAGVGSKNQNNYKMYGYSEAPTIKESEVYYE
jgi:hypothetical protein